MTKKKMPYSPNIPKMPSKYIAWFDGHSSGAHVGSGYTELSAVEDLAERFPDHFYECSYVWPKPLVTYLCR